MPKPNFAKCFRIANLLMTLAKLVSVEGTNVLSIIWQMLLVIIYPAHDMFSRIFQRRICENFPPNFQQNLFWFFQMVKTEKKAFLYLELLVKTIGGILFERLVKTCHELSNYFVHQSIVILLHIKFARNFSRSKSALAIARACMLRQTTSLQEYFHCFVLIRLKPC